MSLEKVSVIRDLDTNDINFIYNAWLKSYRNNNLTKPICNDVFFSNHKDIITNILKNSNTSIICNKDDTTQIYGFITYTSDIIHFCYVKYPYRRFGLGRQLFNHVYNTYSDNTHIRITHYSPKVNKYIDKYNLVFNPYLLEK